MNLWQALDRAEALLASRGIDEARAEAELLLENATGLPKASLYARLQDPLEPDLPFWAMVARRLAREPTAYITQRRSFYGLEFHVDRRVLIPRQETELLVDEALKVARPALPSSSSLRIADVGTGCGAIAVSLAIHLPQAQIYATDISSEVLSVAKLNAETHGVAGRVSFLEGDLLLPIPTSLHVIVANLPYITDEEGEGLAPEIASYEPGLALWGGPDGLDLVRRLLDQSHERLLAGGTILLEIGFSQGRAVAALLASHFPTAEVHILPDFAGLDRIAVATNVG